MDALLSGRLPRQPEPPALVTNESGCYQFRVLDPCLPLRNRRVFYALDSIVETSSSLRAENLLQLSGDAADPCRRGHETDGRRLLSRCLRPCERQSPGYRRWPFACRPRASTTSTLPRQGRAPQRGAIATERTPGARRQGRTRSPWRAAARSARRMGGPHAARNRTYKSPISPASIPATRIQGSRVGAIPKIASSVFGIVMSTSANPTR